MKKGEVYFLQNVHVVYLGRSNFKIVIQENNIVSIDIQVSCKMFTSELFLLDATALSAFGSRNFVVKFFLLI